MLINQEEKNLCAKPEVCFNYPFKNKPFLHQKAYLERFCYQEKVALFADMGTGKTYMLINNAAILYDKGNIDAVLIVAPKGVYRNWTDIEIPKHMPSHVIYRVANWSPSPLKKDKKNLESLFDITEDLKILAMNVEAFSTLKGTTFAKRFVNAHNSLMIVDESTTIKTPKASRSKNAVKVGSLVKYKRIATGSPITKSPMDIYMQCEFLSPSLLNIPSYYAFQARFANVIETSVATHSFKKIVGYRRLDELQEKISSFSFRVTKEECLDLPDKLYSIRHVNLTKEQTKSYVEMKKRALAQFSEGITSTVNFLTQLLRLHQIVCGHVKLDDGQVLTLPNNRLQELLNVIEEADGKIIIWANYRHDIEQIKKTLQKEHGMNSVVTYYGDTSTEDRQEAIEKFQDKDSDVRFFVGNPKTGGYGITLTEASLVVYYSNNFDLEVRLQSEDRAHRIGQTKNVTYVDLLCVGTVDEKIVKALRSKIDIASEVLGEDPKKWLI
jgi:SNF2 family DNA or RNA helicase